MSKSKWSALSWTSTLHLTRSLAKAQTGIAPLWDTLRFRVYWNFRKKSNLSISRRRSSLGRIQITTLRPFQVKMNHKPKTIRARTVKMQLPKIYKTLQSSWPSRMWAYRSSMTSLIHFSRSLMTFYCVRGLCRFLVIRVIFNRFWLVLMRSKDLL